MKNYTHRFEIVFQKTWKATLLLDENVCYEKIAGIITHPENDYHLDEGDEIPFAFTSMIAPELVRASMDHSIDFIRDEYFKDKDGYNMKLDGSEGIYLESCSEYRIPTFMGLNVYQKIEREEADLVH